MSSRLLVIFLSCLSVGCSTTAVTSDRKECRDGDSCSVTGVLKVFPGQPVWGVIVNLPDKTCAKIAFPGEVFPGIQELQGKVVTVQGDSFNQPPAQIDGVFYVWYEERGRRLPFGVCDGGVGIYATKLTQGRKVRWPGP